ncbi:hypothetical protein [Bacteroides sp.]
MAYFPASGWRDSVAGEWLLVGLRGYMWSSSTFAAVRTFLTGSLRLDTDWIKPLDGNARAFTLPVRCVQELAVILYRSIIKARSTVE